MNITVISVFLPFYCENRYYCLFVLDGGSLKIRQNSEEINFIDEDIGNCYYMKLTSLFFTTKIL